jgi:hypothetical protein
MEKEPFVPTGNRLGRVCMAFSTPNQTFSLKDSMNRKIHYLPRPHSKEYAFLSLFENPTLENVAVLELEADKRSLIPLRR